jgi:hypothetical protein
MECNQDKPRNRYQMAVEVLQRGRDLLMHDLADQILDRAEDFEEGGFLFQEFLENQGSKLHFLYLMISQMEQSAELFEEQNRPKHETEHPIDQDPIADEPTPEMMLAWEEYSREADEELSRSEKASKPKKKRRKSKLKTESGLPSPTDENE